MAFTYSFSSSNNSVTRYIGLDTDGVGTTTIFPSIIEDVSNVLYSDDMLLIIYYDSNYDIKVKQSSNKYKFINLPWNITLKKISSVTGQIEIIDSIILNTITVSVPNIKFTNCTFINSDSDPNPSLIINNITQVSLNFTGCIINFNNVCSPIEGYLGNTLTTSDSSIRINPITTNLH